MTVVPDDYRPVDLDELPDAIVVVGAPTRRRSPVVLEMNAAAERLLGTARADIVGRPAADALRLVGADGRPLRSPVGKRVPLSRGIPEREYGLHLEGGAFLPVTVRCAYRKDGNDVVRALVCVMRDARARRGMDMRTVELISTVSHEIRSPLTSIKGFTKTLLDRWDRFDDDIKREMLEAVNTDADRVKRLIDELLDVSRLEAGRLRLRPQRVELPELAQRVAGKVRGLSERHRISVRMPAPMAHVMADPDKIEQVLTNLLENALKYTESGTVRVTGRITNGWASVSVADQGEGIPEGQLPRLFRKFVRSERAGNPSGTGLGLYIARGLIEAHGGHLVATSKPGKGTTFTFSLPVSQGVRT